jgi:hypothetical protein
MEIDPGVNVGLSDHTLKFQSQDISHWKVKNWARTYMTRGHNSCGYWKMFSTTGGRHEVNDML